MNIFRIISVLLVVIFLVFIPSSTSIKTAGASAVEKIKPEEVIAKHLESIGTREALASVGGRIVSGACKFNSNVRLFNQAEGPVVLASEGAKSLIGMTFGVQQYPFDKLGYDGRELTTSFIRPGIRSVLSDFILTHDVIFREGLFGGALSSAWPLLDPEARKSGLEYGGKKKVDNRECQTLKYNPRGGSDLRIKLFFDDETYRHVRTEYERFISARTGSSPDQSASQRETRYLMTEEFSDFDKEGGLMLPHTYKLKLIIMAQVESGRFEWTFNLQKFEFKQQMNPGAFTVN